MHPWRLGVGWGVLLKCPSSDSRHKSVSETCASLPKWAKDAHSEMCCLCPFDRY